jgi:hypothetical protein
LNWESDLIRTQRPSLPDNTSNLFNRSRIVIGKTRFNVEISYSLSFTHSLMELSPSWEAVSCAATQELSSTLWNQKFHYSVHKNPPLVPILSQIDPVHTSSTYLSKIRLNIVHLSTSWSS